MRCGDVRCKTTSGVVLDARRHLVFKRTANGLVRSSIGSLRRADGPVDVVVVPSTLLGYIAQRSDRFVEAYGFLQSVNPQTMSARNGVRVEPESLWESGQREAWAAHVSAQGESLTLLRAAASHGDIDRFSALALMMSPREFVQAVNEHPLFSEWLLRQLHDKATASLLVSSGVSADLAGRAFDSTAGRGFRAPTGLKMVLSNPATPVSSAWGGFGITAVLGNPNLSSSQVREAVERFPWGSVPVFKLREEDAALREREFAWALSQIHVPAPLVAQALERGCHELVAAAVVRARPPHPDLVEFALAHPSPAVRRALTESAIVNGDNSTISRLTDDHDIVVRCILAEKAPLALVANPLGKSTELDVLQRLHVRGVPAVAVSHHLGVGQPPAWKEPTVSLYDIAESTSFGSPVDNSWTGRSVAARLRVGQSQSAQTAREQALALVSSSDPRTRELAGLLGVQEFGPCEDRELSMVTVALSGLWTSSGNVGVGTSAQDWFLRSAARAHGIPVRFDRGREFGVYGATPEEHDACLRRLDEVAGTLVTEYFLAAHAEARDRFRACGFSHVPLSRGMRISRARARELNIHVWEQEDLQDGVATFTLHDKGIPQAPLSSWGFGDGGSDWGSYRGDESEVWVTIRAMVPVEQVAGFGGAGMAGFVDTTTGAEIPSEGEVLVLDADRPSEIFAVADSAGEDSSSAREYVSALFSKG